MFYNLVKDSKGTSLTVFLDSGEPLVVQSDHPNYQKVYDGVVLNDSLNEEEVKRLLDLVNTAGTNLTRLSERVSVKGNTLYFDGDAINSSIGKHIVELIASGDNNGWQALVAFLEKISTNPNENSRENLYDWLNHRFTLTPDGDFIAYKGVNVDASGINLSVSSGTAIVNGTVVKGKIPNQDGSIIEMPRSDVQHNPSVACSTGLHAGTYEYASSFVGSSGRILIVKINPRDVVSVPSDSNGQKLRVCRYVVLSSIDNKISSTTFVPAKASAPVVDDDDDDDDYFDAEYYYDDEDEYLGGVTA